MAVISKRVSGSWVSDDYAIMKTATDTITTLPAVLYPTGSTATVGLKGQAVQSSTPSPASSVIPQGTGERSENILSSAVIVDNTTISEDGGGTWMKYSGDGKTIQIPCNSSTKYYLTLPNTYTAFVRIYTVSTDDLPSQNQSINALKIVRDASTTFNYEFTTNTNAKNIILQFSASQTATVVSNSVLSRGYKIPISSANTTTPVYLGGVQTTRKVKKLVLTGEEDWQWSTGDASGYVYLAISNATGYAVQNNEICSHFVSKRIAGSNNEQGIGVQNKSSPSNMTAILVRYTGITTNVTTFKSYLAQQYANGTPVCVWYVLATPETAVVNEPLMKIGDYADEVSNISIPVTAGGDTLSVGTTVQPSEVTATYKGWHPVADVHERSGGQWV